MSSLPSNKMRVFFQPRYSAALLGSASMRALCKARASTTSFSRTTSSEISGTNSTSSLFGSSPHPHLHRPSHLDQEDRLAVVPESCLTQARWEECFELANNPRHFGFLHDQDGLDKDWIASIMVDMAFLICPSKDSCLSAGTLCCTAVALDAAKPASSAWHRS